MATYKQIQNHIKEKHNHSVKTCWIADIKEQCGLNPRKAHNRYDENVRLHPCPDKHKGEILGALIHFKMVDKRA